MLIFEKNSIFNFSNPTFYNLILPYKTQILTYLARRFNKRDRTLLYVHAVTYSTCTPSTAVRVTTLHPCRPIKQSNYQTASMGYTVAPLAIIKGGCCVLLGLLG